MSTNASTGYGSKLYYSLDNTTFTAIAQLQHYELSGSKQSFIDQTNQSSPGNFTQPVAVQVDGGELEFSGVYKANDASQLTLGQLHGALTLAYWRNVLSDGSYWQFQATVSEFTPWGVVYNKFIPFSGKLRLTGGMESPLSAFQPDAFDPAAFQVVLI